MEHTFFGKLLCCTLKYHNSWRRDKGVASKILIRNLPQIMISCPEISKKGHFCYNASLEIHRFGLNSKSTRIYRLHSSMVITFNHRFNWIYHLCTLKKIISLSFFYEDKGERERFYLYFLFFQVRTNCTLFYIILYHYPDRVLEGF